MRKLLCISAAALLAGSIVIDNASARGGEKELTRGSRRSLTPVLCANPRTSKLEPDNLPERLAPSKEGLS